MGERWVSQLMTNGQVDNHLKGSGLGPYLTAYTQKTKVIKDFCKQTKPHKGTKEKKRIALLSHSGKCLSKLKVSLMASKKPQNKRWRNLTILKF